MGPGKYDGLCGKAEASIKCPGWVCVLAVAVYMKWHVHNFLLELIVCVHASGHELHHPPFMPSMLSTFIP